jgi:hypothetical protein
MLFTNILLGIAAVVLLLGVVGERDERRHQNVTIAFVAVCFLIFALNKLL